MTKDTKERNKIKNCVTVDYSKFVTIITGEKLVLTYQVSLNKTVCNHASG
jgi:hypothetical protein